MQFIRNGPDIPERLLQEHEDGRVVFFCGAGVSYPARLPGFGGLVDKLFNNLNVVRSEAQKTAINAGQHDTAIGLLENGIVGGREEVRSAIAEILTPDLSAPKALATHDALLTLGRSRDGHTRLVTTNFDRLFENVLEHNGLTIPRYQAPLLPVPKKRWDGLVYLHGLLPDSPMAADLDALVVSSGDFGLAYLSERWAARFVSELFRTYTVCFVGYSINDPVLRYMMDALAADRLLGEDPPEAFAFGAYSRGKAVECANEWHSKNVTPILYKQTAKHTYLHNTLREWARTYRDGVRGKERIVVDCALTRPMASTEQDNFVGRLLWALSDPLGLPAKRFADLDPVPSIEWLEPLSEERYGQGDLYRFGVSPKQKLDTGFSFSLTRRPPPYDFAPCMALADAGAIRADWDDVMRHLARWLIRHLDDPGLLLWVVKRGGHLHENFSHLIRRRLNELAELEQNNHKNELDRIKASAPNAVPRPLMRKLWRLLLSGRIRSLSRHSDIFNWQEQFRRDGLTTTARLELREILRPCVSMRDPVRLGSLDEDSEEPQQARDLVDWEFVLAVDDVRASMRGISESKIWQNALPDLLTDFNALLIDMLDIKSDLGAANIKSDLSYIDQPSISVHSQNMDFRDWTVLIDFTRDAWIKAAEKAPDQARRVAEHWMQLPYPLFRRMAFFAATHVQIIPVQKAINWLLDDDEWWLWSIETERVTIRLLSSLSRQLNRAQLDEVIEAILRGPPHSMFEDNIDAEDWQKIVDREIWLRLSKMADTEVSLGPVGKSKLAELSAKYPSWQLASDESDEFPVWMGEGDDFSQFLPTPRRRRDLVQWLKEHPTTDIWQDDDWRQRCRDDFSTTAVALCELARENIWPIKRWQGALQAWSEEGLVKRSWRYMAPVIISVPDECLADFAHSISWWLRESAKTLEVHEGLFFYFCRRLLELDIPEGVATDDPVIRAINHPIGHVTEALLRWWYASSLQDNQGLPTKIVDIFTAICNRKIGKYVHGRVLLSAHVIALFRVDQKWAGEFLLPLFDWEQSEVEARGAWEGFLWSPRLYRPLFDEIKPAFLETALRYERLGKHGEQYASLLTFAALDRGDTFTISELAIATRSLPPEGLRSAAQALVRALEGAGDQRVDYWDNRVLPYLRSIWPKTRDRASPAIAASFGRLCVAAKDRFPEAVQVLQPWLQPVRDPAYLVSLLYKAGLCEKFPESSLNFLDSIIGTQVLWVPNELKAALETMSFSNPDLISDNRYDRLVSYVRRYEV